MKWLDNEQMYPVRNASPIILKNWIHRKKVVFFMIIKCIIASCGTITYTNTETIL